MSKELIFVLIGAASAIIGGLVNGVFDLFWRWFSQPVLSIDYLDHPSNRVEVERKLGEQTIADIYVRPRITNRGRAIDSHGPSEISALAIFPQQ